MGLGRRVAGRVTALPWDRLRPFVEGAFGPGKRVIRADLIRAARAKGAPPEVMKLLERVDYGINFSDLDALQSYMMRVQLTYPSPPEE
jgi:hypothetical protein